MPGREIYGDLMAIPDSFALSDFDAFDIGAEEAVPRLAGQKIESLADFEAYLVKRSPPEDAYGMFSKDVTMCRFFNTKNSENILVDIEQKNAEQGMGNVEIPNTNIRLINYSVCPKCGKVFSFKELGDYYRRPKSDSRFSSLANQARNDTRVCCPDCETWFLPALIIADNTPKNEVQFLCRNQTMDTVEKYFMAVGKKVLTKKNGNVLTDNATGLKAVKNDVPMNEMAKKPTLIANMLQYTPANLAINLMDGSNIEKGDVLYGWWGKRLAA
jgi:hypothetical protein